jgi:hypothetical protein
MLAMVETGLGIAVLSTYAWAGARAMKISTATLDPSIARDIAMITRTGRSIPSAVSAFARFLGKYTNVSAHYMLKRYPAWMSANSLRRALLRSESSEARSKRASK